MTLTAVKHDPKLDLVMERVVDVAPELIWKAWTTPESLKQWFTPAPWSTVSCTIDLRPGGLFHTVMRSPEGQEFPNAGCYLEVVENKKLVWTDALVENFRPSTQSDAVLGGRFTGIIMLTPHEKGTLYTAIAMHSTEVSRKKHEAMGFHEGWSKVLDQLVAVVKAEQH